MRILANYGYKDNGNTYSVTFETVGDVAKENADAVVDELFSASLTLRLMPRYRHPEETLQGIAPFGTLWNFLPRKKKSLSLKEMATVNLS
jgi:hypothetical protein